ncbi:hypothetical protein NDU88_001631 [Pleurodeles waltl]|uniref:Uncharacterized protein n=1 Tax=Pleurodeles waltl TaxID=8319 RepID=A0AAV7W120_PLEWA|nr:hypothetical protein NDU88_001631 [Pleurodeles waltl]
MRVPLHTRAIFAVRRERPALRAPGWGPAPALCWGCERPWLLDAPCANLGIAPAGPHVLRKPVVRHRPGEYGRHRD